MGERRAPLDQIALDGCDLVQGGGECDDGLERVFGRAVVEQHARSTVSEYRAGGGDEATLPIAVLIAGR
jgi:hypothetical protein